MRLIDADSLDISGVGFKDYDDYSHYIDIVNEAPTIKLECAGNEELISKKDAISFPLSYEHYDKENGNIVFIHGVESYREYIEGLPNANVIQIVRCEDCKHKQWDYDYRVYRCKKLDNTKLFNLNFFCGYGERE